MLQDQVVKMQIFLGKIKGGLEVVIQSINNRIQQISRELDNDLLLTENRREKLVKELQDLLEQRDKYNEQMANYQWSEREPKK